MFRVLLRAGHHEHDSEGEGAQGEGAGSAGPGWRRGSEADVMGPRAVRAEET